MAGASFGNEVSVLNAGQSPDAGLETEVEGDVEGGAVSTGTEGAVAVGAASGCGEGGRTKINSRLVIAPMMAGLLPHSFQSSTKGPV